MLMALVVIAALGADSLVVLESCDRPAAPVGQVSGEADILFHVDSKGRIAADSIMIIGTTGVSHATVASVVQRVLPRCRARRPASPSGRWVSGRVDLGRIESIRDHAFATARRPTTVPDPLSDEPAMVQPDQAVVVSDPRIEERPRVLRCRQRAVSQTVQVPAGQLPREAMTRTPPPGVVRLRYVIDASGKVRGSSVVVVELQGANYASEAQAWIRGCTFAPGRIDGQPVAVEVQSVERFGR